MRRTNKFSARLITAVIALSGWIYTGYHFTEMYAVFALHTFTFLFAVYWLWYRTWWSLVIAKRYNSASEGWKRVSTVSEWYYLWSNVCFILMMFTLIVTIIKSDVTYFLIMLTVSAHSAYQYDVHWVITNYWLKLMDRLQTKSQKQKTKESNETDITESSELQEP